MLNDLLTVLPLTIVALLGCFVLLLDVLSGQTDRRYLGRITAAGFALALGSVYLLWGKTSLQLESPIFGGIMVLGRFELLACAVLLLIGLFVTLMSIDWAPEQGVSIGELYALVCFAVLGMMLLVTATHMISLFLGLEVMSVAIYVLAAFKRNSPYAAEAGMKYFVLGAFGTGLLLYGMAYAYGATGKLAFADVAQALAGKEPTGYVKLAVLMLVAAFGFKLALVPFHMWTPDVYEGAPAPVTALMAAGVKTAAVIAAGRVFVTALPPSALGSLEPTVFKILGVLAVITMTAGNLMALPQRNLKRMLAYSAVAHAGYLLIGLMAAHHVAGQPQVGDVMGALLVYLFVYALANLAAFAVVSLLGGQSQEDVSLDHLSGLSGRHPLGAAVLALAMLSLAGVPPTAGFFGKLTLFKEALRADEGKFLWLVVLAVLNSVVSVFYYLRVLVHTYFRDALRPVLLVRGTALTLALGLLAFLTLQVGLFPSRWFEATAQAARPATTQVSTSAAP